jgi:hypothetical protein
MDGTGCDLERCAGLVIEEPRVLERCGEECRSRRQAVVD